MTEQPEPAPHRVGDKNTCRHCTEEIIWEPWFNDNRGPNPPVWSHTRSGVKSCSRKPVGWTGERWPFAEPEPHICKPDASTYFCPIAGEIESDCHGGFDQCCGHPERHIPTTDDPTLTALMQAARAQGLRLEVTAVEEPAAPVVLDPPEPAANPLDSNPEALAWARSKVQQYIERLAEFQSTAQAEGDLITAMACGNARLMAELHFLGDGTRTIGAFDARLANGPQP